VNLDHPPSLRGLRFKIKSKTEKCKEPSRKTKVSLRRVTDKKELRVKICKGSGRKQWEWGRRPKGRKNFKYFKKDGGPEPNEKRGGERCKWTKKKTLEVL